MSQVVIHPDATKSGSTFSTDSYGSKSEVQTFIAGGSITAGQWVCLDVSQTDEEKINTIVPADSDALTTSSALVVGVAFEAGSAGQAVRVIVAGYAAVANIADAATAGTALKISSTAGRADASTQVIATDGATATVTFQPAFGVSLSTPSSNVGTAWVYRKI